MTTLETPSSRVADRSLSGAMRSIGILLIVAAVLWTIASIIEATVAKTDTLADGASFVTTTTIFYAAEIAFVWAVLAGAWRGLAGHSRTGRVGLCLTAAAWILLMVGAVFLEFLGIEGFWVAMLTGGLLRNAGEIVAGIGILQQGPIARPARAIFLVYGLATTIASFVTLAAGGSSRSYLVHFAMGALWAIIGLSLLKPGPRGANIAWFVASLVAAVLVLVGATLP